ncbi:MAG: MBL fold metallo-hydrolase, partial [Anaerolineae bacterium]
MGRVTITTLVENTAGRQRNTVGEWGLAILIDTPDNSILWDTGQGNALLPNAQALQIDLQRIDKVVLSHGHYDHTGGLYSLLKEIGPREVYAGEGLFALHHLKENEGFSFIGVPFSQRELEEVGAYFHFSSAPVQLAAGIWLTGKIPRQNSFEPPEPQFFVETQEGMQPDELVDDRAIFLETSEGLVV